MKSTKRILAILLLLALTVTLCACEGNTYTVTVKYLDENGVEIAEPYIYTGKAGERYDVAAQVEKDIECYEKTAVNGATTGTLNDNIELTVRYAQTAPLSYEDYLSERWRDVEWSYSMSYETEHYIFRSSYAPDAGSLGAGIYSKTNNTKVADCDFVDCILETESNIFYVCSLYDKEQSLYTGILYHFDTASDTTAEIDRTAVTTSKAGVERAIITNGYTQEGLLWANDYVVLYATHTGLHQIYLPTGVKYELVRDGDFLGEFGLLGVRPISNTEIVYVKANPQYLDWVLKKLGPNGTILGPFTIYGECLVGAYDYYLLDIVSGQTTYIGNAYVEREKEGIGAYVPLFDNEDYAEFLGKYKS